MGYIFRLHNGADTIKNWGNSHIYGSHVIEQIQDPNGETAKKEITSIPSPFARIDLVKTAFKKVAEVGVDGNTIHHKMVSDALDIAQIFFEYDKYKDRIDIIVWEKDTHINELLTSKNYEHNQLGDVLKTYIEQDGKEYNLDKADRIYLLNYKDGTDEINILGATSPSTLFFTPANKLTYCDFQSGNDKFFDDDYRPLYKRDESFQIFLYALRKNTNNFARLFPEVDKYMTESFKNKKVNSNLRHKIIQLTANDYTDNYDSINIGNNAGNTLYIVDGVEFRAKRPNRAEITNVSGFVINSNNTIDGQRPLVLPVDTYTHKTIYTQEIWDSHTEVPYYDSTPIKDRELPGDGQKYPYLTIGDFLTDTIVEIPHEINNKKYFDGNIDKTEGNSYLLPLTDTFFHFFTTEDLLNRIMYDGKKMFELINNVSGITAVIRIPIRRNYIEYRRTYFRNGINSEDTKNTNDGAISQNTFGIGILPFVKFPDNVEKHYRVAFFDKVKTNQQTKLTFINDNGDIINSKNVVCCDKDIQNYICSHETYIVEDNFNRIKVGINDNVEGYIIPIFRNKGCNRRFTFAVDYGTTNTHIEYCTDVITNPRMFDIIKDEIQLYRMHNIYPRDINAGFVEDFIPETIGDEEDGFTFPMRTVFAPNKGINYNTAPVAMAHGRIPFLYEKKSIPNWHDIKTELKWGGIDDGLLNLHIESIFILLRNKVILNDGCLPDTKIVWFYPASMTEDKVLRFKRFWNDAYVKYFGPNINNVESISESVAPYCHFMSTQGASNQTITIDIGGGTTDVLVIEQAKPQMLMSFRYASNAIFGDSYNSNPNQNGFVCKYLQLFKNILEENNLIELTQTLEQITGFNKSSDIITFLFSLQGDKVNNNKALNFMTKLQNDDKMRYVFIVFYSSIIYFIAKTMKARGLKKPQTVAFSGNGARTLNILSPDNGMIGRFVQIIFNNVYQNEDGKIEVKMESNPKIATCKGGIQCVCSNVGNHLRTYDEIDELKTIVVGNNLDTDANNNMTYGDIDDSLRRNVVDNVRNFFDFLFKLHNDNKEFLINKLGADASIYDQVKEFCTGEEGRQILEDSLSKGFDKKFKEVNQDTHHSLEDTLFFYPLVGILHDLALKISNDMQ